MNSFSPQYDLKPKHWYKRWWGIVLLILLGLVLTLALAFALQVYDLVQRINRGEKINFNPTNTSQPATAKITADVVDQNSPSLGNPNAKIVIVEFGDFTCPYSKMTAPIMQQLVRMYPQDIKLIFRNLTIVSQESLPAAEAAACAGEQGNLVFWAMHDQLFAEQDQLQTATIDQAIQDIAKNIGIDLNRFNQCLSTHKYQAKIKEDLNVGQAAGATRTPAFFLNGEKIEGVFPIEKWQQAIDYLKSQL